MLRNPWCRTQVIALLTAPLIVMAGSVNAPLPITPHGAALAAAGASASPVRLEFQKCIADLGNGVWEGSAAGDISGDLRTELRDLRVTGGVWQVRFDWIVDAGGQSFVADLSGILNTHTGRVVMNGRIVDGYLEGAQVHEEGQLVDADDLCFAGSIRIMPATAG